MQLETQAFWLPKAGNSAEEYEDAVAYSPEQDLYAVADGASESSFADRWAQILVRQFAATPPLNMTSESEWLSWLAPLRQEWHDGIPWDVLPWYAEEKGAAPARRSTAKVPARKRRVGFNEQRELDGMEERIQAAEAAREALREESEHPAHASDAPKLVAVLAALGEKQAEIDRLYARWSELQRLVSNVPA